MNNAHPDKHGQRRPNRYVAPLLCIAVVALSLMAAANWHGLLSKPAQPQQADSPDAAFANSSETTVPSASSVFTQPSYPVAEHVQAF